jgi:hypothetical protein
LIGIVKKKKKQPQAAVSRTFGLEKHDCFIAPERVWGGKSGLQRAPYPVKSGGVGFVKT